MTAVAFGDSLSDRLRIQAVEVGIQLERRRPDTGGVLQGRPYDNRMGERTHLDLL